MKAFYVMATCVVLAWVSTACCGMLYADRSEEYHRLQKRLEAAEAVIRQVEEDEPDYVMDVLCEGDTYQTWQELAE
jgi:hypothetical protein